MTCPMHDWPIGAPVRCGAPGDFCCLYCGEVSYTLIGATGIYVGHKKFLSGVYAIVNLDKIYRCPKCGEIFDKLKYECDGEDALFSKVIEMAENDKSSVV